MEYQPDSWVILEIPNEKLGIVYKVLAGWSGSYLYGQSWKLNSGITLVKEDEDFYYFEGYSGSTYKCHKCKYGLNTITFGVFKEFKDKYEDIKILDKGTDFLKLI